MQQHSENLRDSVQPGEAGRLARFRRWRSIPRQRVPWGHLAEVSLIAFWAMWIGRAYLNFDPSVWPFGREFGMALHALFPWSLLTECGDCVLWNGFVNGGYPASVDLHGTFLHPLAIASTLLFGAVNGAKIIILFSLAIAGCAQWWIAKTLGLGRVARVWSAFLAAAGGHLAVKMDLGLFPLVFSLASASLVIAAGLKLALTHERRAAVWLGVTTALAILSGQGYVQLGLLLGPLLALLVFLIGKKERLISLGKEFAIAVLVAVLLAGVFWVPLLHFWPNFGKDVDPTFKSAQAIEYIPLNLVIRNADFFRSEALGKVPYPYLYGGYIGWWPVLFAILAFRLVPRSGTRTLIFFLLSIGATFLAASGLTFQALDEFLPELAYGVRNPSLIAGLAVPPVLGLAAWGLDRLLSWDWPRVSLTPGSGQTTKPSLSVKLSWLVLIVPIVWSVKSVADFSQQWLRTTTVPEGQLEVVQAMATEEAQWVAPPFGEHFWAPLLVEVGSKSTGLVSPWHWKDREFPLPYLLATRTEVDTTLSSFRGVYNGINLLIQTDNEYAYIAAGSEYIPCQAVSRGGHIEVECDANVDGTLIVRENSWSGWTVRRDGERVKLGRGPWLNVAAPAGQHHYEFHYRPWDVPLGLGLTLVGIALAAWLSLRGPSHPRSRTLAGKDMKRA